MALVDAACNLTLHAVRAMRGASGHAWRRAMKSARRWRRALRQVV